MRDTNIIITEISYCYVICKRILEERKREKIVPTLQNKEAEFKAGQSTQNCIFLLKQITEKYVATNTYIYTIDENLLTA